MCVSISLSLSIYIYIYILHHTIAPAGSDSASTPAGDGGNGESRYTRSPLEDLRLFRPSPWKILRHYL